MNWTINKQIPDEGPNMIRPVITLRRKRILIDIDTQKDYFIAEGAACIRNHRRVLANVRRAIAWARHRNIRMISTALSSTENGCCREGTPGQKKLHYTIRNKSVTFPADGSTDLQRQILQNYDQVVLEKRCPDPFNEPRAERMLSEIRADEFIVIGAIAEESVKSTVLGLLARQKNVTIIIDAVGSQNKNAAEIALRQMEAKGAKLIELKALVGPSNLRLVGACKCDRCQGKMQKSAG